MQSLSDAKGDLEVVCNNWHRSLKELSEYLRAVGLGRAKRSPYLWSGRPFVTLSGIPTTLEADNRRKVLHIVHDYSD